MDNIKMLMQAYIGQQYECVFETQAHHSAHHYGNEGVHVVATVALIAFIEQCSGLFLKSIIPPSYISVGTLVDIRHRQPASIGTHVRVSCTLETQENNKVTFKVVVFDGERRLMDGIHGRAILDRAIVVHH